jgi:hypothetical protein
MPSGELALPAVSLLAALAWLLGVGLEEMHGWAGGVMSLLSGAERCERLGGLGC